MPTSFINSRIFGPGPDIWVASGFNVPVVVDAPDGATPTSLELVFLQTGNDFSQGAAGSQVGLGSFGWENEAGNQVQAINLSQFWASPSPVGYDPHVLCLAYAASSIVDFNVARGSLGDLLTATVGGVSISAQTATGAFSNAFLILIQLSNGTYVAVANNVVFVDWAGAGFTQRGVEFLFSFGDNDSGIVPPAVTLDVVTDICERAGLKQSEIDVSLLTADNVHPTNEVLGYLIGHPSQAQEILKVLMQGYLFDGCETNGTMKWVPRGLPSVMTIPEEDLGLLQDKAKLVETNSQGHDLPFSVTVLFNNAAIDYQQGRQTKERNGRIIKQKQQLSISLPLTMTDDQARQLAEKILYMIWLERNSFTTNLWRALYFILDPTDVVDFRYQGINFEIRITEESLGQGFVVSLTGVEEDARQYISNIVGGTNGGFNSPPPSPAALTTLFLFDIPLLRDQDSNPTGTGYYYAVSSLALDWPGAELDASKDDATFLPEDVDTKKVSYGIALTTLGPPRSPWIWDDVNTLRVKMLVGSLSSDSLLNVLNGSNGLLVGDETIQFANAVQVDVDTYDISMFLRGVRGTEWASGTHGANENVVMPITGMHRVQDDLALLNVLRYYRAVTIGGDITLVPSQQFTIKGRDITPYAVAILGGFIRNVSGTPTTTAPVTYEDDFSTGTLSPDWIVSNRSGVEGGGAFAASQVDMSQGVLRLEVTQDGTTEGSVGAEIQLNQKFHFGTYEWTMRAASTSATKAGSGTAVSGQISSTFSYSGGSPANTEIDAPEIEGQHPNDVEYTTWLNGVRSDTGAVTLANPEAAFHRYKYVWARDSIKFYIDDVLVFTTTTNVPTNPAFPLINLWGTNSSSFGGVATAGVSRYMYVSSFKYWSTDAVPVSTVNGDFVITWFRRTRIGGALIDGTGTVPLSEDAELYDVEILNGSTVLRTIRVTTPTCIYSVAQQIADFGSPQKSITVNCFQISGEEGRGFKATAVVPTTVGDIAPVVLPATTSTGIQVSANGFGANVYVNGAPVGFINTFFVNGV
jgi:hypothetical protein